MTDRLSAFAARFQAEDVEDPTTVIESVVENRRDEFDAALDEVCENLSASESDVRERAARLVYDLSELVPETLVRRGTELTAVADDEALQPYVDGALTNTVFNGVSNSSAREGIAEDLAQQARAGLSSSGKSDTTEAPDDAVTATRYLAWLSKRWEHDVATIDATLVKCLSSEDPAIREAAARVFAVNWSRHLDRDDAIAPLLDLTEDSRPVVRATAIATLGPLGFPNHVLPSDVPDGRQKIIAAAADLLTDEDHRVRYSAAYTLGRTACYIEGEGEIRWPDVVDDETLTQCVVDRLVELLSDSVDPVVRHAAAALNGYSASETDTLDDHIDRLVEYGWDDTNVNHQLIQRCVKRAATDNPSVIVDHAALFLDELDANRDSDTAEFIDQIATVDIDAVRDAVPILVEMLGSPDGGVRRAAAQSSIKFYRADPDSVPDYVEIFAAASNDPEVSTGSRRWEPLVTLAEEDPDVATEFAIEAIDRVAAKEEPHRIRLPKKLADTEIIDPVLDRLVEVIEKGDRDAAAAAISSLSYLASLDDPPELPPSTMEVLESRRDDLPEDAEFDAQRVSSLVEEQ